MNKLIAVFLLLATVAPVAPAADISTQYKATSQKLIAAALEDTEGLARLEYLCDRIGNRVTGSVNLQRAITWAAAEMKKAGFENIQTQPVKVPHWIRGKESATLLGPVTKSLTMLGLGLSVGTPKEGLTADVVIATSFDDLTALGREKVAGKIVLFNPEWRGYGQTVTYRATGASKAAELGAVAMLVRSMTGTSLQSPHTGTLNYTEGVKKIPAAALSVEDTALIARVAKGGAQVRIHLMMEALQLPDADSHNVIGEIRGSELPNEVVVLGGHIDSWDVGQGANDDGSGIMATFQAVALIRKLGLKPRRTIRVVFWTAEENSGSGGKAYREMVGEAIKDHVAAIEMDGGAEKPLGFGFGSGGGAGVRRASNARPTSKAAFDRVLEIGKLLESIDCGRITPGGGGADISPLIADGVPGFGVSTVGAHYNDWHHTQADTFDKIVPRDFQLNVAQLAVMSYVLADMPGRLDQME